MAISGVVQEIEEEIARLEEAKRLLQGGSLGSFGRKTSKSKAGASPVRAKRTLSAAGRKAIAAAQKARWAKVRKAQKAAAPTA